MKQHAYITKTTTVIDVLFLHRYMYVILHALVQEPILRESMKLLAMVQVD